VVAVGRAKTSLRLDRRTCQGTATTTPPIDKANESRPRRSANLKRRGLRGAAKRSQTNARDIELKVWKLLSQGKTPTAIANQLGLARQSVHRIIRRVEARYNTSIMATVAEIKARQAIMLEGAMDEAMSAWERSKNPSKRIRKQSGKGGVEGRAGQSNEHVETQVESQVGDPRYLAEARAALADLRKLYGLNAPAKSSDGAFGGSATTYVVSWGNSPVADSPVAEATAARHGDGSESLGRAEMALTQAPVATMRAVTNG